MSSIIAQSAKKRGSLTISGSGIASVSHITLGTLAHIKEAEKVFYVVCDPLTEAFIRENATGTCCDLTVYYDKDKDRYDSYIQMCEVMLIEVRAGYNVLGIFYGHPGVFVSPSHRAIALAREEEYNAKMLPGISAEDYLFADLEFDPATYGCMTSEATELLMRNTPLNTSVHNIIWQVGAVGVTTMVYDNAKFHLLVDRLETDFGPDHKVVHYIGAVLPQSDKVMDTFSIGDLRKEEVIKQFNSISTLYIPPLNTGSTHPAMAELFGTQEGRLQLLRFSSRWIDPMLAKEYTYGPQEKKAIAQIDNHVPPKSYTTLNASPAIIKFMTDLVAQPKLLQDYEADPVSVVNGVDELSASEKFALRLGKPGPIYAMMSATLSDIANKRTLSDEEIAGTSLPIMPTILIFVTAGAQV